MGYAFPAEWNLAPGVAENLSKKFGDVDPKSMLPAAPPGTYEASPAVAAPTGPTVESKASKLGGEVLDGLKHVYNPLYGAQKAAALSDAEDAERKKAEVAATGDKPGRFPEKPPEEAAPRTYGQAPIVVRQPGGGGAGHPAGWVPGPKSISEHEGMSPEEVEAAQTHRQSAAGQRLLGADAHLAGEQQMAAADVGYAEAEQKAIEAARARDERSAVEKQMYQQKEQEKLQQLSLAAQRQVDPEVAKGNAGQQLFSAIAIGLGQFGASLTGGQNTAYQIVKDNIDRNLASQRDNIANAGKAHDREQNLYQQNLAAFGDRERASVATKMQLLEQAKAIAHQQYAKAKGTMVEGDYHDFVAKVDGDLGSEAEKFAQLTHTDVTRQESMHYQQATSGGAGLRGLGDAGMDDRYVPSHEGFAPTKEIAQKLNEHDERVRTINATLSRAEQILRESQGLSAYLPSDIAKRRKLQGELDSLTNSAAVKQTVKEGQGAQSKGDKEVSDATLGILGSKIWGPEMLIPGAATYYDGTNRKNAEIAAATAERNLQEHRRLGESYNVVPGQRLMVEDKNGNLQPRGRLTGERTPLTSPSIGVDDVVGAPKGRAKE